MEKKKGGRLLKEFKFRKIKSSQNGNQACGLGWVFIRHCSVVIVPRRYILVYKDNRIGNRLYFFVEPFTCIKDHITPNLLAFSQWSPSIIDHSILCLSIMYDSPRRLESTSFLVSCQLCFIPGCLCLFQPSHTL
jgi:hypothetical protein